MRRRKDEETEDSSDRSQKGLLADCSAFPVEDMHCREEYSRALEMIMVCVGAKLPLPEMVSS